MALCRSGTASWLPIATEALLAVSLTAGAESVKDFPIISERLSESSFETILNLGKRFNAAIRSVGSEPDSARLKVEFRQLSSLTSRRYDAALARRYPGTLDSLHASLSVMTPFLSPSQAIANAMLLLIGRAFLASRALIISGMASRSPSPASC